MGRKIPAKKHRGVKDPLKQQAQRLQSIKNKINAPPKDPDEQPVPRSLTRLFAFQDKDKNKNIKKNKVKKLRSLKDDNNISGVGVNPISRLRKLPGESAREFSLRINSAIKALHDPMEQQEYPQDIEENDVKGEHMAAQRERRARKRKRTARAAGASETENKGASNAAKKPSRIQRYALKKKAKLLSAAERAAEGEAARYERVPFGEVAHAPPALQRTKAAEQHAHRPGQRDLLLKKLLKNGDGEPAPTKRSPLPLAERARRERARLDAVAAYRALKANKTKQKT